MSKTFLSCYLLVLMVAFSGALQARAQGRGYTVQVASAPSEEEARATTAKLKAKGLEAYWVKANVPGIGVRYRVRVGKFKTQAEAKAAGERGVSRNEIKEFLITAYETPAAGSSPGETIAESKARSTPESAPEAATSPPVADAKPPVIATPPPPTPSVETPAEKNPKPAESGEALATNVAPKATAPAPTPATDEPKTGDVKIESRPAAKTTSTKGVSAKSSAPAGSIDLAATTVTESLSDVSFSNDHWKIVRRSAAADKNLRSIYFVDAMTGWAAGDGGVVHRTTDGGRNWKPMATGAPANINFIFFADWNNGWMLGDASNEDGGETILLMTTNGGKTWARKPMPNLLSLHFIDPKNGWAVGKNATLMKTKDGGENWTKIDSMESLIGLPVESTSYNYGFRDIQFIDALHGWLVGNFYGRARNNIGGVFFTTDGGATWKRAPITIQTQHTSGRFTPGVFESIKFTDLNTGSITGEMNDGESRYSLVLHTKDGGKTWNQFRTPSRAIHSSTQFLDLANGWMAASAPRDGAETAVFDTTMMRTDNGGQSWRDDFVAKGRRIRSVFFLSPTKGWAVGDRGMILRYEEKSRAN